MEKRERLERTFAGDITDRVPAALWRHWPGDDQRSSDLARAVLDFQKTYDWDFIKITPDKTYSVTDYGVQHTWAGNISGTRDITRYPVTRTLDWTDLRALDPTRGTLGKTHEAVRMVAEGALADQVPVMATIFSPLIQARYLAGDGALVRHLRTQPDRVHTGLNAITETTLRFIDTLKRLPISGIFFAVQHASYDKLSEEEYKVFGFPYDCKILDSLPEKWWFNMIHLHGSAPMFKFAAQYPNIHAVNWHDRETEPDLNQGKLLFNRAVCGGIAHGDPLHQNSPSAVRDQARDAILKTNGRRLILATGCVSYITSPQSNLRAVREIVEEMRS